MKKSTVFFIPIKYIEPIARIIELWYNMACKIKTNIEVVFFVGRGIKMKAKLLKISMIISLLCVMVVCVGEVKAVDYDLGGGYYKQGNFLFQYISPGPSGGELGMFLKRYEGTEQVVSIPSYVLNEKVSVVTPCRIKGIATGAFQDNNGIMTVEIPASVTDIREKAFSGCTNLQYVSLVNVDIIGYQAFYKCESLKEILISPQSLRDECFAYCTGLEKLTYSSDISAEAMSSAFSGCSRLKKIVIKDGVTKIPDYMFRSIASLTEVEVPNSVTEIGENIFNSNSSVAILCGKGSYADEYAKKHNLITKYNQGMCGDNLRWYLDENGVLTISGTGDMYNYSYSNHSPWYEVKDQIHTIKIEYGCNYIGDDAFENCTAKTVFIPDSVTKIGRSFVNCPAIERVNTDSIESWLHIEFSSNPLYYGGSLYIQDKLMKEIVIPDTVTNIPSHAFEGCLGLTKVIIPESVESIGALAFSYCSDLTEINLPDRLEKIESSTFSGCENLKSIDLPNNIESIDSYAFADCLALESIIIPDDVTNIGCSAFQGCQNLRSIILSENLEKIENYTFANCMNLKNIDIPDNVSSIGTSAFQDCSKLKCIMIGKSVKMIKDSAFRRCENLEIIYWNAISVDDFDSTNYIFAYAGSKGSGIHIIFGNEVKRVPDYLFLPRILASNGQLDNSKMPPVTCIVFGDTLSKIGGTVNFAAFSNCSTISEVYYPGSKEEWESFIVRNGISKTYLSKSHIHYLFDRGIILSPTKIIADNLTDAGRLIIASYEKSETIDVKTVSITETTILEISEIGLNTTNADKIKVFLWQSIGNLKPICDMQYALLK